MMLQWCKRLRKFFLENIVPLTSLKNDVNNDVKSLWKIVSLTTLKKKKKKRYDRILNLLYSIHNNYFLLSGQDTN